MKRFAVLALLLLAACDGGISPGSTVPYSGPSTTEPDRECRTLAESTAEYLAEVIGVLNDVTADQVADPAQWPPELVELQARGEGLDRQVAELGCDPLNIQLTVLGYLGELEPESPVARLLVDLLQPDAG